MKPWMYALIVAITIAVFVYVNRKSNMDAVIRFIIKWNEGGFQNDPNDPGNYVGTKLVGTKYGIAARYHPTLNIRDLTLQQAVDIYRAEYLSKLPVITNMNLLYQVLDMAINAGVSTAKKLLLPGMSANDYRQARKAYYKGLNKYPIYYKAWNARADRDFLTDKNKV